MPSFSEIQEEIQNMLEISDEELNDEQKAAMDAYLDELATQEAAKVDGFAQYIKLETARALPIGRRLWNTVSTALKSIICGSCPLMA